MKAASVPLQNPFSSSNTRLGRLIPWQSLDNPLFIMTKLLFIYTSRIAKYTVVPFLIQSDILLI